jgi:hypothetical protein
MPFVLVTCKLGLGTWQKRRWLLELLVNRQCVRAPAWFVPAVLAAINEGINQACQPNGAISIAIDQACQPNGAIARLSEHSSHNASRTVGIQVI